MQECLNMDISLIEKKILKFKSVSFDIFDTLLKRDVFKPSDVFYLVQLEYEKKSGIKLDFKKLRIEAEKRAREKTEYPEVTLDEIYEELNIQDKEELKSLEVDIECRVLHCNFEMKAIYDRCKDAGKDIYIISDMYLPTDFLATILQREGYDGYKALYVSAEYRKTKRSGELYKILLESQGIRSQDLIHIGDSRYADYFGARKCGIKAIKILRISGNTIYIKKPDKETCFENRSLFSFINSRVRKYTKREEKLGYEVLGPILYSYSKWIHDQYERVKNTDGRETALWFVARDMYLFKQVYETIYGEENDARYIYISRKSLRPVLTYTTGDISETGKAFPRGQYTIKSIVERMGYTLDALASGSVVDDRTYNIRSLSDYPEVISALSSSIILENEKKLAEPGIEYLKVNGLFDKAIILADVGWHGTTQYLLREIQRAVSDKGSIFGLYLGCLDSTNERIGKENYLSFAFSQNMNSDFSKGILLFETLILAPHGSTMKYRKEEGTLTPVLGKPDNISDNLLSIQRGALDFVKDFKDSIFMDNIELSADVATKAFCNLAIKPQKEELDTLGNLDYDDFGTGKLVAPKSLVTYVKNPKLFYHDLKHSPWRIGFLYKLFKVRLPYAKIYSLMREKQGKAT